MNEKNVPMRENTRGLKYRRTGSTPAVSIYGFVCIVHKMAL